MNFRILYFNPLLNGNRLIKRRPACLSRDELTDLPQTVCLYRWNPPLWHFRKPCVKCPGVAPGCANAQSPGRAKNANTPPLGLTTWTNVPWLPGKGGGGGGMGTAGIDWCITSWPCHFVTLRGVLHELCAKATSRDTNCKRPWVSRICGLDLTKV